MKTNYLYTFLALLLSHTVKQKTTETCSQTWRKGRDLLFLCSAQYLEVLPEEWFKLLVLSIWSGVKLGSNFEA